MKSELSIKLVALLALGGILPGLTLASRLTFPHGDHNYEDCEPGTANAAMVMMMRQGQQHLVVMTVMMTEDRQPVQRQAGRRQRQRQKGRLETNNA
jgi:hypothetical protein